jgi:hypothetical protein
MIRSLWQKRHRSECLGDRRRNEEAWMRCMDRQIDQQKLHVSLARVINAQAAVINVMHARLNLLEERQPARPVRRTTISREPLTVLLPTKKDC